MIAKLFNDKLNMLLIFSILSSDAFSSLSTYLPIIIINTNGQTIVNEPKITADMKIIHHGGGTLNSINDEPNVYNGKIGIEIRGASSSKHPQTPYGIETRDSNGNNLNVSLLGMPAENDWVLISNWNDKSFARNLLSYSIFSKMGHYAPRMQLCEVVVNNEYRGIYLFGEKIKVDKGRTNIANLKSNDLTGDELTGGYIFKTDYYDGAGTFWSSKFSPINRSGVYPQFIFHDPKGDELVSAQKTYISAYVHALETALYSTTFVNPATGYRAYLDVNSFVDYFILQEVARNIDGYKKSRYFHKNKDSKNKLIVSGPAWDYDWAWKNISDCILYKNTTGEGWAWDINFCKPSPVPPSWEAKMLHDPYFANSINARYFSLRKNILSTERLYQTIDSVAALVNEAQVRHYNVYSITSTIRRSPELDSISTTYTGEIDKLKNWIAVRLAWLDANMVGQSTSVTEVDALARIRIFPNPVQETLFVESDNEISVVTIFNAVGSPVLNIQPDNFENRVGVSFLTPGIYHVKVTLASGESFTQKLIKE